MIFLEFLEGQGLGNQLWNYVALRSISKKLRKNYKIVNPEKFKGKEFLKISFSNFKDENNSPQEFIKNTFYEKLFFDKEENSFVNDFDQGILNIEQNTKLKGLFQSEKYLFGYDINDFIGLKKKNKYLKDYNNICILNIRGGEYKRFKNLILPKSYWINAMKNMQKINHDLKFVIVTDDNEYSSKLLPNIEILKGNIYKDFLNLFYAKYLILSNSSFSYFPIKLGEKPNMIIAPSHWSRFGNNKEKWISPANYYSGWQYQNIMGEIISDSTVKNYIEKTKNIYSSYHILTTKENLIKKTFISRIPTPFKKSIKKILSKIFPLNFG